MIPRARPPGAELTIALPGAAERKVPLTAAFAVGRGSGNDLVLKDARASRSHALLRPFRRGKYFLLDMGSANGTFLNGRLVTSPAELKDGDVITIADCAIKFEDPAQRENASKHPELDTGSMDTAVDVTKEAISLLIVDIRNFTGLTEAIPPNELPGFVGAWFRDASATIESYGGVIDKFIGDAVMAYWLGSAEAAHPRRAHGPLDSALELVDMAMLYHGQLVARHPDLSFTIGCGLHRGEAMFGNIGKSSRRDFTAIGDCVNMAFRIESLSKELGRPIVVSEEIKRAAGAAYEFEDLGARKLKGKNDDVRVFAPRRPAPPAPTPRPR